MTEGYVPVAREDEVALGEVRVVDANGKSLALGHCADGSLETFVNGLPTRPLFVTFITRLPTFSTEPEPKMSGIASGLAPRRPLALACTRASTSCS